VGVGFLPWTLLSPVVVWLAVRHWWVGRRPLGLLLAWIATIAVIFTLVVRPRAAHFLPLSPALALLVGWAWQVAAPAVRRRSVEATAVIAGVVGLAGAAFWVSGTTAGLPFPDWIPLRAPGLPVATLVVLAAGLLIWWLARRNQVGPAGLLFCGATLVSFLAIELGVHAPAVNARFPTHPAAMRFASHMPEDAEVIFLNHKLLPALLFYVPQRAREVASSDDLVSAPPRGTFYVLFVEPDFTVMRQKLRRPLTVLEQIEIDRTLYVLGRVEAPF
jgi:hypothetical protein